ncbi:thrombomodulin-like [Pholidichthys leucotaenia]
MEDDMAAFPRRQNRRVFTILACLWCAVRGNLVQQTCRPVCVGRDCLTVNKVKVDFKTAEESCRHSKGELLQFHSEMDQQLILETEFLENVWIGLRLPTGVCSDLSAPLRGYKWTSGTENWNFNESLSSWKEDIKVCSPHCVSLSDDHKWMEKLCSEEAEGFLCRTDHKDACWAEEVSKQVVFQSSKGCTTGPCQQVCQDVKGGYICSCSVGFLPNKNHPERCERYCPGQKCPAICEGTGSCVCPDGFLLDEEKNECEDINECDFDQCDQDCRNTFGSFMCSCRKGFVLKNQVRCIKEDSEDSNVSTVAIGFVKPSTHNNMLKKSSAPAGSFLWIWAVLVAAVVVFILIIRVHVVNCQRRRQQANANANANVDNV